MNLTVEKVLPLMTPVWRTLELDLVTGELHSSLNVFFFFFFWQVKVQGQNEEMLLAACEQFLGKAEQEIRRVALETLGEIFYLMKLLLPNGDTHLIF